MTMERIGGWDELHNAGEPPEAARDQEQGHW